MFNCGTWIETLKIGRIHIEGTRKLHTGRVAPLKHLDVQCIVYVSRIDEDAKIDTGLT